MKLNSLVVEPDKFIMGPISRVFNISTTGWLCASKFHNAKLLLYESEWLNLKTVQKTSNIKSQSVIIR